MEIEKMIQGKYFCINRTNPNILNYLSTAGPLPDTGRVYINAGNIRGKLCALHKGELAG